MKLLLCLAFLFLIVNSSAHDFLTKDGKRNKDPQNDVSIFVESLFNHFGLEKPAQILKCFDKCHSKLFFKELSTIKGILEDSRDRKSWSAHIDYVKLELLNKGLHSTWSCIMMTQDFTNFLDALKIDERNPDFFEISLYFYYQAFYPRLADDIQPLVNTLKAKDFSQAGDLLGELIDTMVNEIREDGFSYLALASFLNGANSELAIDFPKDSLKCHNRESATAILKFLWKLSNKVAEGDVNESLLNTINFWHEEGEAIINTIPDDVLNCHMKSDDVAKLSDRLKIRVGSQAFRDALLKFISKRPLIYSVTMRSIRDSFGEHNYIHGGYTWGHFLDHFSKSLPYHDDAKDVPKTEGAPKMIAVSA